MFGPSGTSGDTPPDLVAVSKDLLCCGRRLAIGLRDGEWVRGMTSVPSAICASFAVLSAAVASASLLGTEDTPEKFSCESCVELGVLVRGAPLAVLRPEPCVRDRGRWLLRRDDAPGVTMVDRGGPSMELPLLVLPAKFKRRITDCRVVFFGCVQDQEKQNKNTPNTKSTLLQMLTCILLIGRKHRLRAGLRARSRCAADVKLVDWLNIEVLLHEKALSGDVAGWRCLQELEERRRIDCAKVTAWLDTRVVGLPSRLRRRVGSVGHHRVHEFPLEFIQSKQQCTKVRKWETTNPSADANRLGEQVHSTSKSRGKRKDAKWTTLCFEQQTWLLTRVDGVLSVSRKKSWSERHSFAKPGGRLPIGDARAP